MVHPCPAQAVRASLVHVNIQLDPVGDEDCEVVLMEPTDADKLATLLADISLGRLCCAHVHLTGEVSVVCGQLECTQKDSQGSMFLCSYRVHCSMQVMGCWGKSRTDHSRMDHSRTNILKVEYNLVKFGLLGKCM